MRLQEAADFVGLWAYLTVLGGAPPDREVMQAIRSATLGPQGLMGAPAAVVEITERPSGWAVTESLSDIDPTVSDEVSDLAAAS
ncbi:MAG: hypothetical protein WEE64_02100 [Dehalococcoidia bacterium]